jgi:hypothetical protein
MAKINDETNYSKLKDDTRLNIMMALEGAKAMKDDMLIYLIRLALEQLYVGEPQASKSESAESALL